MRTNSVEEIVTNAGCDFETAGRERPEAPLSLEELPVSTESVCPVCLQRIPATREVRGDDAFLAKECPRHGPFETVIWRGRPSLAEW